jgi:tetratricopeptide (TPR) repeat protein
LQIFVSAFLALPLQISWSENANMFSSRHDDRMLGVAHLHTAGRFAEAEPLYRQALNRSPDNFDALHLYGVLLSQTGRADEAETLLRRAVYLRPGVAAAQSNLGNLLRERNRPGEALPHLRRAVEADPKMAAAHQNLGVVLNQLGESDEAEQCFRRALALQPNFPEGLNSLGNALRSAEKLDESERCYREAIALRSNYSEAHTGLGATLNALHRYEESLASCRRAVALKRDYPEARNNLAMALLSQKSYHEAEAQVREALRLRSGYVDAQRNLGSVLSGMRRYDEALVEYKKALELDPKTAGIWMDLGSVQRHLRRFDEAKFSCRRAIELNPTAPMEYYNLGVVHLDLCEIEQAIACFRRAVEVKPSAPLPHWGLALALLVDGQYIEGWREYEWRWECTDIFAPRPKFAQPAWAGDDPTGKRILVYPEQGLGDAIQFARYAPLLSRLGANVTVQCAPSTKRLFATLPGVKAIHCEPEKLPEFDAHCPLLSLPMMLKTTVEAVPAEVPYLFADPDRVAVWERKLAAIPGKLKLGIAWAGNPEHQRDQDRSCGLALLAPLGQIADVALISLQKGPAAAQAATPPPGLMVHDFTAELSDFAETAALIASLDLVIAVDTSVAHLAGALGKPVWTLLAFAPDWRWLLNRTDSPWYPTMRLFRQSVPGDWSAPIQSVSTGLAGLARNA